MAPHSSTLAWKIPWTEEPGGLPSKESHTVGHDWGNLAAAAALYCPGSWRTRASLIGQLVKNPPAVQETWVRSLGWEDLLEKRKATHSSILAWRIPWTTYSPWGHKESDMTERHSLHYGEQCRSCKHELNWTWQPSYRYRKMWINLYYKIESTDTKSILKEQ